MRRARLRTVVIVSTAIAVLLAAGIGTASAAESGWPWHRKPTPRPGQAIQPPSHDDDEDEDDDSDEDSKPGKTAPAPTRSSTPPKGGGTAAPLPPSGITAPPVPAGFDYQIQKGYAPAAGIRIVTRDHTDTPLRGNVPNSDPPVEFYNVCYVNAFQTQQGDTADWRKNHADLLLRKNGREIGDARWGELLLDISTPDKRTALAGIVGKWIDECASKGFKGVEFDNLDSRERSEGLLKLDHEIAFAKLLVAAAHAKNLAAGQKNDSENSQTLKAQAGFDFAIAEECGHYDECGRYASVYSNKVLVVEYNDADLKKTCGQFKGKLSIVRRDVEVEPAGVSGHVFKTCP